MNTAWARKTVGEVLRLEYGKPLDSKDRKADGLYPVYGANGEKDRSDKFYFDRASIIVGRKGSAGEVNLTEDKFWPLDVTYFVTFDDREYDLSFLYYLLQLLDLPSLAKGVKPGINRNEVYSQSISVPPLAEQQRIVRIIDKALEGIASVRLNAELSIKKARAMFDSERNNLFERGGPGWTEKTLDQISNNLDSRRVPITKSARKHGEYPYYGASGIVDYVADYIFEGDSLLVSEDGANLLLRSTPIAFSVSGKYWVNNHAHILSFESMATQRFVEFYLESIKLDDFVTGAAQPKLTQKSLNSIPIPIPQAISEQSEIVGLLEALQTKTNLLGDLYQRKLVALDALRESLLEAAFSGKLEANQA